MKRIITFIICILLICGVIFKYDDIISFTTGYFSNTNKVIYELPNKYSKRENYDFVQISDDFIPYSYQDLLNIYYTILDSGYDTLTFYCPAEYLNCISDVEDINSILNVDTLTTIGNYVSPYNNFTSIKVSYDTAGEVTLKVNYTYSDEDIKKIDNKIDEIWNNIVTSEMNDEDIIYAFHDYIINNSKYDENYEEEVKRGSSTYKSNTAYGPLFEGYAICSGYTDAMAIILDRLNIKNFKVASETHVWNAAYVNGEWLHIDLTWDDPVSENRNIDTLLHKFFLINTETLEAFNIEDHDFDKSIYTEVK